MKVYGALESAQIEWFTNAGKPSASSYPYRVIYVTDLKQIQVSDGTNWNPTAVRTYTAGTLPSASAANQYQLAFITDTLQVKVSDGSQWKTIGARLDTYTSGTIPAAASNSNSIIWVSDLQQVQVSNGTAWVQVGSKAGTKNYFSQNNANADFETNSVSPWSACTLTFSSGVPSGAPTLTATQMAIAPTATTPLSGTYSMELTKSAANAQYQGFISGALTIDREDTAKVLYGSFYYEVMSGTIDLSGSSTQSLEIWIYNTVSGQWIQPAGYRGMNQSSGVGKVVFSFQTDGAFSNNAYKIAVITQQTGTSAYVVKFDDFQVGPVAISTIQLRNPAGTIIATGSLNPPTGYLYCNGAAISRTDYSELYAAIGTTYGIGDNVTTFNIPDLRGIFARGAGTNPDNASNTTTIGARQLDIFKAHTHTNTPATASNVGAGGGATVGNTGSTGSTGGTETRPANVGVAYHISYSSGYVQTSSDTDTRVVAASASLTGTFSNSYVQLAITSAKDTHGAIQSNTYVIPVSGWYSMGAIATSGSALSYPAGSRFTIGYSINNPTVTNGFAEWRASAVATVQPTAIGSDTVYCNAGDIIRLFGINDAGSQTLIPSKFWINRQSGPSVITATETVAASYWTSTNGTSTTTTAINFDSKEYDTHNAVTPGANWKFTAPVSGTYNVSFYSNQSTGSNTYYFLYKNSITSAYKPMAYTITSVGLISGASTSLRLNAGDYIGIYTGVSAPYFGNALLSSNLNSHITITRTGN